jgi:signal transduction histidine kinase
MESLGILAGGVAHDMNNILGAIMGITSLLRQDSDADSSLAKDYDTIVQACTRGRTMVRGLLDFTRQEPSNFLHIDLNAIVLEQCNLLTKTLPVGVRLDVLTSPDLLPMLGDINKLQRVVLNLCTNAVDAVGSNGRVGVETRNNDLGEVELVVHDDGPGMQPEVLGKAFEPFFTTKPVGKGKGLGLAIVYGTVRSHHGHIDIKTGQGLGTRVVVRFPAYQSATPKPAESTFSKIAVRSLSHTVLLVDGLLVARLRHFYTTALVRTRLPLPAHHSSLAKRTNRGRITLKP